MVIVCLLERPICLFFERGVISELRLGAHAFLDTHHETVAHVLREFDRLEPTLDLERSTAPAAGARLSHDRGRHVRRHELHDLMTACAPQAAAVDDGREAACALQRVWIVFRVTPGAASKSERSSLKLSLLPVLQAHASTVSVTVYSIVALRDSGLSDSVLAFPCLKFTVFCLQYLALWDSTPSRSRSPPLRYHALRLRLERRAPALTLLHRCPRRLRLPFKYKILRSPSHLSNHPRMCVESEAAVGGCALAHSHHAHAPPPPRPYTLNLLRRTCPCM